MSVCKEPERCCNTLWKSWYHRVVNFFWQLGWATNYKQYITLIVHNKHINKLVGLCLKYLLCYINKYSQVVDLIKRINISLNISNFHRCITKGCTTYLIYDKIHNIRCIIQQINTLVPTVNCVVWLLFSSFSLRVCTNMFAVFIPEVYGWQYYFDTLTHMVIIWHSGANDFSYTATKIPVYTS